MKDEPTERDPFLRFRAAHHEMRCRECRVTWRSLVQRLFGIRAGFTPKVRSRGRDV